jgi:CO/xanthine dehydrogenase Mo-binding subunit
MSATAQSKALARREVLAAGGLLVAFSFSARSLAQLAGGGEGGAAPKAIRPDLPGSLKSNPELDSWISIGPDGKATVFSGKVELGQGIRTALLQVAAEELDLPPSAITFITADTARTPDEGLTAGSHSMQDGGTALANAGANVRMLLTQAAARVWSIEPDQLTTTGDGHVAAPDGRRLSYGQLATRLRFMSRLCPTRRAAILANTGRWANFPRVDIPAKLVGGEAFVQDMRLPGMLHARVVRGRAMARGWRRRSSRRRGQCPVWSRSLRMATFSRWSHARNGRRSRPCVAQESDYVRLLPPMPAADGPHHLQTMPSREIVVLDTHDGDRPAWKTVRGSFSRPWYSHGSIGPSCAVALARDGGLTIWSHSQGVFDMHRAIAELVGLAPEKVRCIHPRRAAMARMAPMT